MVLFPSDGTFLACKCGQQDFDQDYQERKEEAANTQRPSYADPTAKIPVPLKQPSGGVPTFLLIAVNILSQRITGFLNRFEKYFIDSRAVFQFVPTGRNLNKSL